MQHNSPFPQQYKLKAYFAFLMCFAIFFIRFLGNGLFSQMVHPLFLFPDKEWAYHLFIISGIGQYITSHRIVSGICDGMIFFLPLLFLITQNRLIAIIYTLLITTYLLTFNIITGHHNHGLIGMLLITVPFWSQQEDRFNFLWQGARYYLLYIFSSAAGWKILRGSAFFVNQLSNILKGQQVDMLYLHPGTFKAGIVNYLIAHPNISHTLLLVNVLVQLSFAIGFFTKRFDTVLFFLAILFVVANYFVMGIVSAELLILTLTLWNWDRVEMMTNNLLARYADAPTPVLKV